MATPNDAWSNRKVMTTVIDSDPPQSSGWSGWAEDESSHSAWATKKKPQRATRRPARPTQTGTEAADQRPIGRWIAAVALWSIAGGLFAGRAIAGHVDAGVEAGMEWLAVRAPSFLRPYLPAPVPKLIEPKPRQVATSPIPAAEPPPPQEVTRPAGKEGRKHRHR